MIRLLIVLGLTCLAATAMAQTNNSGHYTNMLRWRQEVPVDTRKARIEQIEAEIKRLREELRILRDGRKE